MEIKCSNVCQKNALEKWKVLYISKAYHEDKKRIIHLNKTETQYSLSQMSIVIRYTCREVSMNTHQKITLVGMLRTHEELRNIQRAVFAVIKTVSPFV